MKREFLIDTEEITRCLERRLSGRGAKVIGAAALVFLTPLMVYAVANSNALEDRTSFFDADKGEGSEAYRKSDAQSVKLDSAITHLEELKERLMPTTCPDDMALGGLAGTESAFCIEINERSSTTYHSAVKSCTSLGRHVCTQNQFWIGTGIEGVINMTNNWEWVGDRDDAHSSGHLQVIIGGNGTTVQSWAWAGQHNNGNGNQPYRCCQGGISSFFD